MITQIVYEMPKVEMDQVMSVYVGKPGLCMCGCNGKYTYNTVNRELASKDCGYEVKDEEVNDKRTRFMLSRIAKNANLGVEVLDRYIFTVLIGKTQYSLYAKKNTFYQKA